MKVKLTFHDIGPNHASVEFEDEIPEEQKETWFKKINENMNCMFRENPIPIQPQKIPEQQCSVPRIANTPGEVPASPQALKAFEFAAKANHTTVPEVCKQHGVNPDNISKKACQKMTSELNDNSGYSRVQQKHKKMNRQLPVELPDDSDIFE